MINQLIINLLTSTLSKKKLIIVICILLTSFLSGCQLKVRIPDKYESCVCITKYDGNYYGDRKDGIPHGQGTMIWTKGEEYKGEWQNGKPHGKGRLTLTDKSFYDGEFKFGKLDGQGSSIIIEGHKYIGEFKDGKMHGQGTFTNVFGNKFVGEMKDNMRWNGVYNYKDGKIIGKVVNGEKIKP